MVIFCPVSKTNEGTRMTKPFYRPLSLFSILFFSACGGGGGGDTPTPTPVKAKLTASEDIKAPQVIQSGKATVLSYTVTNPVIEAVKLGAIGRASSNTSVEIESFDVPQADGVELTYDLSLPQNTCFDHEGKSKPLIAGSECNLAFIAKLDEKIHQETNKNLTLAIRTSDNAEDLEINKSLKFVPENDARLIDLSTGVSTSTYLAPGKVISIDVKNQSNKIINALNIKLPQWLQDIALELTALNIAELKPQDHFNVQFKLAADNKTIDVLQAHSDDKIDVIIEAANAKDTHIIGFEITTSIVNTGMVEFDKPEQKTVVFSNATEVPLAIDSLLLENVADDSVIIVKNTCVAGSDLKANDRCEVILSASADAHKADYEQSIGVTLGYQLEDGTSLTTSAAVHLADVTLDMQQDIHIEQSQQGTINITNNSAFSAYLPDADAFSIIEDEAQNISDITIDPESDCFNNKLVPEGVCTIKVNTTPDALAGAYVLTMSKANNISEDIKTSFYVNDRVQSIEVEATEGSSSANMEAIKLTNNGHGQLEDIEITDCTFDI